MKKFDRTISMKNAQIPTFKKSTLGQFLQNGGLAIHQGFRNQPEQSCIKHGPVLYLYNTVADQELN